MVEANPDILASFPAEVPDLRAGVILPGGGRSTQQERADRTNRLLLAFLADVTADGVTGHQAAQGTGATRLR